MTISYAQAGSGPSAGGIGWFNFTGITVTAGSSFTGLTGTLNDGTTVTFNLTAPATNQSQYDSSSANVGYFGTFQYTNISGAPVLYAPLVQNPTPNNFLISNIVVKDSLGNPVPNYTVIVVDAEATNELTTYTEYWEFGTNGGPWSLFHTINPGSPIPTLTGTGTQNATITGVNTGPTPTLTANYMLATQSPSSVSFSSLGHQAMAIGFATTRVSVQKDIGARIDPADQFTLNVAGTPSATATTTGAASGIQTQVVNVFAIPGNPYVINEAMAPGSVSALTDYTQIVSAANATPAGSVPPTGNLPITFTPALGDYVTYTILNTAPQVFTKTVDKEFADLGDILTYTVTVDNPNNFALSNVLVTDATPIGTTYIGNLTVSQPYTGTDPATGLTITSIPANSSAVITYEVQVNSLPPISIPIANYANVTVPGGVAGMTNVVTTQVNTAYVTVNKLVDKAFAHAGDILTYTLLLMNAGNVAANSVTLTDAVPSGTTFVPGSVTGATGSPPTLTLAAPLAPGASTTITFQVQVGNTVPSPNPILNNATVNYTYTVDPANPNGTTGNVI